MMFPICCYITPPLNFDLWQFRDFSVNSFASFLSTDQNPDLWSLAIARIRSHEQSNLAKIFARGFHEAISYFFLTQPIFSGPKLLPNLPHFWQRFYGMSHMISKLCLSSKYLMCRNSFADASGPETPSVFYQSQKKKRGVSPGFYGNQK